MEEYLTIKDVCDILRLSKNKVYSIVNEKDFPKIRIGTSIRIPKCDFEKYMKTKLYKKI